MKLLIVGFDPGTTSAMAALDLRGNLIGYKSKKGWTSSGIKKTITEIGRPLFIAVDRAEAPESAKKLAAAFNCKLFSPEKDLAVEEKNRFVAEFDIEESLNNHERDAIASAVAAWKSVASQFSKIDANLEAIGMKDRAEKVKEMIVTKKAKNISEALERLMPKKQRKEVKKDRLGSSIEMKKRLKALQHSLEIHKIYIKKLEKKANELEKEKKKLKKEQGKRAHKIGKSVLKNREIALKDRMIAHLEHELKKEREQRKKLEAYSELQKERNEIISEHMAPVVPVKEFSRADISRAEEEFRISGSAVWIENWSHSSSACNFLVALRPRVVIGKAPDEVAERLCSAGIVVVDIEPRIRRRWAAVEEAELESAIKKRERKGFLEWLRDYRQRAI